ncbi:MAG: hypothetical protein ABL308_06260 [Oceanicaulis sp.]
MMNFRTDRDTEGDAGAHFADGAACPPPPRPGETPIDLVVGLAMRFALIVQFLGWAYANTASPPDRLSLQDWLDPAPGLREAASVWTLGGVDPGFAAFVLLASAVVLSLSLAAGFLTRISGLLVVTGAVWHVMFVLPEAWPSTLAYAAIGGYLALRGAGPVSIDWILARLARIG